MTENVLDQAGEAALYRALRQFWHPVLWADELFDRPVAARLLDEPIVLVRLDGSVRAFKDLCVHRGTALSLGWVDDDHLVCAFGGRCVVCLSRDGQHAAHVQCVLGKL